MVLGFGEFGGELVDGMVEDGEALFFGDEDADGDGGEGEEGNFQVHSFGTG